MNQTVAGGGSLAQAIGGAIGKTAGTATKQPNAPVAQGGGSNVSGTYAADQAAAQQAYENAMAQIAANRTKTYAQYGYNPDGTIATNNPYGLYQQDQRNFNTGTDRLNTARTQTNQDYQTGITRSNQQSGLIGQFDAKGNPTGLGLTTANPHGDFEQMLAQEADDLSSANDDARARGLGGRGLGAQAGAKLAFQQAGDRGSYRNQLLNSLIDNHTGNVRQNQDFDNQLSDLKYQWGLDQYNIGNELTDALAGLDQQQFQAGSDFSSAQRDAGLNDILNNIGLGNFTPGAGAAAKKKTTASPGTLISKYLK